MEFITREIEYGYFGCASYRIRMKETPHGWMQRHEWRLDNGEIDIGEWLPNNSGPNVTMKECN